MVGKWPKHIKKGSEVITMARQSVMAVYKKLLERAKYCEKEAKLADKRPDDDGYWWGMRAELYHWLAELENTNEINPVKN